MFIKHTNEGMSGDVQLQLCILTASYRAATLQTSVSALSAEGAVTRATLEVSVTHHTLPLRPPVRPQVQHVCLTPCDLTALPLRPALWPQVQHVCLSPCDLTALPLGPPVRPQVQHVCLPLCDLKDSSLPGFSVHKTSQARILEGLSLPPSGGLPGPGTELGSPVSPARAGGFFTTSAAWEAPSGLATPLTS